MEHEKSKTPKIDDAVIWMVFTGAAESLWEAEEMYLDASLPEVYRLLGTDMSDDELANHPLFVLMREHGSGGRRE
jgi:hypothetical protein